MLRIGRQGLDIPPGDSRYLVSDSFVLPVDAEIQAVQPHAHRRAKEVKAWASLPDGLRQWLIHISHWGFQLAGSEERNQMSDAEGRLITSGNPPRKSDTFDDSLNESGRR